CRQGSESALGTRDAAGSVPCARRRPSSPAMAESRVTLTDSAADGRSEEPYSGRTAWARNLAAPVRDFLRTETGGAAVLLAAALAALAWANSPWSDSYQSVWTSKLSIRLGSHALTADLRHWLNEGLMTF